MEAGQNGKFVFNKQVYRDLGLCGERGGFIRENAGKSPRNWYKNLRFSLAIPSDPCYNVDASGQAARAYKLGQKPKNVPNGRGAARPRSMNEKEWCKL